MTLIYLSCAWVLGIFLGSIFDLPPALALSGLLPLFLLLRFWQKRKSIILTGLCLILLFAGAYRYDSSVVTAGTPVSAYNGSQIEMKGTVSAEPEVRDKVTHLRLSAREVKIGAEWQKVSGDALLFVPRYPSHKYGDILRVKGKLETPLRLGDFDYQAYLAHQGIYSTMLLPRIDYEGREETVKPLEWLYSLRERLSQVLSAVLPEPQASLAQGIVLGIRSTISPSLKTDLSRTGTAHLLAISGMNLSIIAGIMVAIGLWLFGRRRYIYVWLALSVIWLYSMLTGMEAPVVRSAIMASLFLFAELLGRQRSAMTALAFAAAVMIGINPQILWSASFQLSFLSMAGLIFIAPPLRTLGRRAVNAGIGEEGIAARIACVVTDSLSVTLGAIIAVWALIAHYFGIVSFIGPVATLLAAPALPGIIVTGALTAFLGLVSLPVAYVLGWLAWLFLSYMLVMVNGFALVPLSFAEVALDLKAVWAYYAVLAAAMWLGANRIKLAGLASEATTRLKPVSAFMSGLPMKWVVPPLLSLAILTSAGAASMPDDNLHVSILNVGQGDAILVQRGSQQVLIDGGPSPQAVCLGLGGRMPFWDRTIELVVLTHPHSDHLTGLVEVLRRYRVKQLLVPQIQHDSRLNDEWLRLLNAKNIKPVTAQAGQRIDMGNGAVIEVLNPQKPQPSDGESDVDNSAAVLRLRMGEVSFIFTADIRQEAEFELLSSRARVQATVLKVAHHGSDTGSSQEFLSVVSPQVAVISVGAGNRFGHPAGKTMTRLKNKIDEKQIYRTDRHGAIELITDGKRLWVRTER